MIQNNLISGIYDLHYIVSSVMADIGETDNAKFKQLLKWAIDGYRRINLAGTLPQTIKTSRLTMSDSNTIDLPHDYIDYIKIGVCIGGYLVNFDHHPDMCIAGAKKDPCGDDEVMESLSRYNNGNVFIDGLMNWGYLSHFHNGQHVSGYYGVGEGFSGRGYRIDHASRKIHFSSYVEVDEIVLEYRTKGIDETGNAIVPETAISTLTSFVHWKISSFKKKSNAPHADLNQAMYWERQWKAEWKGMVRRKNAMSQQEWYTVIRKSVHQLPKR